MSEECYFCSCVKRIMKKLLSIIFITFLVYGVGVQAQNPSRSQTTIQLAVKYYSEKNFEKAAPLLKDFLKTAGSKAYFKYYLTCLFELKQYEEAEKTIKAELKGKKYPASELYIHYGYLYKIQGRLEEAGDKYNRAIQSISGNRVDFLSAANTFTQWGEYEYAKKTYLLLREKLPGEQISYELARVYYTLRDYGRMMEEYLDYLKADENVLPQIQSTIGSAMVLDFDNELKGKFRMMVLKRMQAEPGTLVFNRLYIWFLLQEQNFPAALRQSIALDKRVGNEDAPISNLAAVAANNRNYEDAQSAYEYLMSKGESSPFYLQSYILNLQLLYTIFEERGSKNREEAMALAKRFKAGLEYLKYTPISSGIVKEYAHLLAFSLGQTEAAIEELKRGIAIRGLEPVEVGELKTEMADIYVYANDPWEATLIYSQVIEENKSNPLGDEVKLKKAKLSYYLCNFSWAQAQLDVIKASTSKLTSNDAFELSLLIGSNLNLDTTSIPLEMFARADLLFFRNEDSLALAVIDSVENLYPSHTLVDDILYRKAKIRINGRQYNEAAADLQKIVDDFSYESLADDALFLLAEIYQKYLNDAEKAKELYSQMLVSFPGSIYVVDSRKRFRELRGDKPEEELPGATREELYMRGL